MSVRPNAARMVVPPTPELAPEPGPMTPTGEITDSLTWVEDYFGPKSGDERTTEERVQDLMGAYRAEVLREAADRLEMSWGGPDHEDGVTEARIQLRRMAEESAA